MNTPPNHKNLDQKIEEISKLDQEKCLELLNEIFFNSNKAKNIQHQFLIKEEKDGKETTKKTPEDNIQNRYKELSTISAAVIKRLDELDKQAKIDTIKDILGDLSQEEILKALGIRLPTGSAGNSQPAEKETITTKIVDLKGAVVSVTVGKRGAVAKPKDGEATDTYDFFQEVSRMNEGKVQKDKITKESLSKLSPAEIAETFADYIAKVKAQAA